MAFSETFSNCSSNLESELYGSKIIVLKKIRSLRQLRRTEKDVVRLCYKVAIIKGVYPKKYTAIYCPKDKDMGRMVLFRDIKEVRRAGKQRMVYEISQ